MDDTVAGLVNRVRQRLGEAPSDQRILIGLCGVPGSGKSQLARHVTSQINKVIGSDLAIVVGMDGWHLTRAQLNAMSDPQLAKDKRGAAWTFDAKAFADFVALIRSSPLDKEIKAPSFSHSLKDPIASDVSILPHHRIIILEGLYANIDEGDWINAAKLYDERWVVECDEEIAKSRLVARHVITGVAKDEEEANLRAVNNDIPNGHYLLQHVLEPSIRLKSIDDLYWRGAE